MHSAGHGGAEHAAIRELEVLRDEYEIVVSIPDGPLVADLSPEVARVGGLAIVPLWGGRPDEWVRAALLVVRDAFRARRMIREHGIHAVLTNSSTCMAAVVGGWLARVPVVVRARDWPASRLSPVVFALEAWLARAILAVSPRLADQFGTPRAQAVADGIGIPVTGAPAVRLMGRPVELIQVGGLDPRKGQDLAIDAVAALNARGTPARLTLVGRAVDAGYASRLRVQAAAAGVTDLVVFLGELPSVDEVYATADIALSAARGEWTPLWLMEAQAHGLPVVALDVGSVADVIVADRTGLLVTTPTAQVLADALERLIADPARAQAMGRAGFEYVRSRFDEQVTLVAMRATLAESLRGHLPT